MPHIAHFGAPVPDGFELAANDRPVPLGGLDVAPVLGLVTEESTGFSGRPGIEGHRADGSGWSPRFVAGSAPTITDSSVAFSLVDDIAKLGLDLLVELDPSGALVVQATLTNNGDTGYVVSRLAPSIPVPAIAQELITFTGRWCLEFQPQRGPLQGLTVVENRRGRTSHDRLPAMFAGTTGFGEQTGDVWGVQLEWSGNFAVAAEQLIDGRRHLQAGELLASGELELAPGESYTAPRVVAVYGQGLTAASQAFHRYVRGFDNQPSIDQPRPVLLNTWEAVYFDHNLDTLKSLADAAVEVGAERFVLDDGWFGSRRDDTSGLGDWWVSEDVWPDGLGPIVDHVTGLGMEFGLWFEPEMVNPDSDLYRAHPEWAMVTDGYEPVLGRQQLVLDLGRPEVRDHLFDAISAVLSAYDIGYVKWDMNRDVVAGSGADGRAGGHHHVVGLYELLARLRAAHPNVEIESCSSGGGRIDLGILRHTERVWTSDCNDAVDRQAIQRGYSMLFPPELMGAHLGPEEAHTTHRTQSLPFRLGTAFFGHMGIEWNVLTASADERKVIAAALETHKRLRPLLHGGDVVRVDHPDADALVHGVVSADRSHALFAYAQTQSVSTIMPLTMRFAGLDPDATYTVSHVDDFGSAREFGRTRPAWIKAPTTMSGQQLMNSGLQPPVLHAESVLLVELTTP